MMTLASAEHKSIKIWTSVWISRLYQHSAWLIAVSTSWIRLFESEWPKWLSILTSCELSVKCFTVTGVITRQLETQCRKSWAIDMTCLCFWSDGVGRSADIASSSESPHSTLATRSGMSTLFSTRYSGVGGHAILSRTVMSSARIFCAHLNTWWVLLWVVSSTGDGSGALVISVATTTASTAWPVDTSFEKMISVTILLCGCQNDSLSP